MPRAKPREFMGFVAMYVTKSYEFTSFGDIHAPSTIESHCFARRLFRTRRCDRERVYGRGGWGAGGLYKFLESL
jgi:hypothetical protein